MIGVTRKTATLKVNASGELPELPADPAQYPDWWEESRIVLNRQRTDDHQTHQPVSTSFDSALEWNHTHRLGRYPLVQVLDSAGTLITPAISHPSPNQVTITHATPTAGTLILY